MFTDNAYGDISIRTKCSQAGRKTKNKQTNKLLAIKWSGPSDETTPMSRSIAVLEIYIFWKKRKGLYKGQFVKVVKCIMFEFYN